MRTPIALFSLTLLTPIVGNALTLVSESFGGSGAANLNGTTADVFDSALIDAGGSASWSADTPFKADGSVSGSTASTSNGSAAVFLGTYLNDAKGLADSIFQLDVTITDLTANGTITISDWMSAGFFTTTFDPTYAFYSTSAPGYATSVARALEDNTTNDFFLGSGTNGSFNAGIIAGTPPYSVTLTTILDLTPDTGYNGTNNFGTVYFYWDGELEHTATFTSNWDIRRVGLSYNSDVHATVTSLTLSQIPEPSHYAMLAAVGALGLCLLRRR